jgi:hypothetical protein
MLNQKLKKIVQLTTHTQRNWDVSIPFPHPHTEKIVDFTINHPSRNSWNANENGINYFDLLVITDSSIKRAIYDCSRKNPQILAPLVLIWVSKYITATDNGYSAQYNEDQEVLKEKGVDTFPFLNYMTAMHVGLSSAYANTMAGNLGYKTGCCKCFTTQSTKELKHILGVNQRVELMLGIGEADETKKHNEDQETSFNYGTIIKEPIKVINL